MLDSYSDFRCWFSVQAETTLKKLHAENNPKSANLYLRTFEAEKLENFSSAIREPKIYSTIYAAPVRPSFASRAQKTVYDRGIFSNFPVNGPSDVP